MSEEAVKAIVRAWLVEQPIPFVLFWAAQRAMGKTYVELAKDIGLDHPHAD